MSLLLKKKSMVKVRVLKSSKSMWTKFSKINILILTNIKILGF